MLKKLPFYQKLSKLIDVWKRWIEEPALYPLFGDFARARIGEFFDKTAFDNEVHRCKLRDCTT